MIKVNFQLPFNVQLEGSIEEVNCFRYHPLKRAIYLLSILLTGGLTFLLGRWVQNFWIVINLVPVQPQDADIYLVKAADKTETLRDAEKKSFVMDSKVITTKILSFRFFYFYLNEENVFIPLEINMTTMTNQQVIDQYHKGILNEDELQQQYLKFGRNSTAIPDKSVLTILIDEVLTPFYIFQMGSICLWIYEEYTKYAMVILGISVLSILETLYDTLSNHRKLQAIANTSTEITVFRYQSMTKVVNGKVEVSELPQPTLISSRDLLTGDLIELKEDLIVPCDVILLNGQVIMNEAMLTGESIPVTKNPLPYNGLLYNPNEEGKQSTILAGTLCIDTKIAGKGKIPVLGVVTQTSFNTLKGQLIRSILFTVENSFKFYEDSMKYILALFVLALIELLSTIQTRIDAVEIYGYPVEDSVISIFDLITCVVPPALPTCMQIGVSIGIWRLRKKSIFCISPQKVNMAGKVKRMCFDKTGTLTEDGLDLYGMIMINDQVQFGDFQPTLLYNQNDEMMRLLMAACHGLSIVNKKVIGDPLDERLFESTKYVISESQDEHFVQIMNPIEGNVNDSPINTLRKFEFSSKLQRMSVIVQYKDKHIIFCKGSPEKIKELCHSTTIPQDNQVVLDSYAQRGYRLIACGYRVYEGPVEKIMLKERDEIEAELNFMGLLILENKLKPITTSIITHLHEADIRTVMITGDNILTAISVAMQCGILDPNLLIMYPEPKASSSGEQGFVWKEFGKPLDLTQEDVNLKDEQKLSLVPLEEKKIQYAVSGVAFTYYCELDAQSPNKFFRALLDDARVYARMRPEEKGNLIKQMQLKMTVKTLVGFCGDGANDCAALKTADVGISLSPAEASIAAPFTSSIQDISCVITLLSEGRAALATSFSCFKYMVIYAVCESMSVCVLYFGYTNLTEGQFLYIDLFLVLPLSSVMGLTNATETLSKQLPRGSLISAPVVASLFGQSVIQAVFQGIIYACLIKQDWYVPSVNLPEGQTDENYTYTYESTVNQNSYYKSVSLISFPQYLFVLIAFSTGKPFRKEFYSNILQLIYFILSTIYIYSLFITYKTENVFLDQMGFLFSTHYEEDETGEQIMRDTQMTYDWITFLVYMSFINGFITLFYEWFLVEKIVRIYYSFKQGKVVTPLDATP